MLDQMFEHLQGSSFMLDYSSILAHSHKTPTFKFSKFAVLVHKTVQVISVHVQKTGLHKILKDLSFFFRH